MFYADELVAGVPVVVFGGPALGDLALPFERDEGDSVGAVADGFLTRLGRDVRRDVGCGDARPDVLRSDGEVLVVLVQHDHGQVQVGDEPRAPHVFARVPFDVLADMPGRWPCEQAGSGQGSSHLVGELVRGGASLQGDVNVVVAVPDGAVDGFRCGAGHQMNSVRSTIARAMLSCRYWPR